MTLFPITLATSGLLGLIYLSLTVAVVRQRFKTKVMLGDGTDSAHGAPLHVAVRAHGNFAEYVPLSLILLGGIEAAGAPRLLILILAAALVLGRLLHPLGMGMKSPNFPRAGGAMLNWAMLLIASITALIMAFQR